MSLLALFSHQPFYHHSLLVLLLGAQTYQSFLANLSAQNALSRSQFAILMAAIWPMYSKMQMIGSVLLALTYPGGAGGSASVRGLVYEADRQTVMLPLTMMVVSSAVNALVVIPKTVNIMWKLHVEIARDGKAGGKTGLQAQEDTIKPESVLDRKALQKEAPKSPEVKAMTNKFLAFHGVSFALNMVTLASGIYYAMRIAEKGL